MFYAIFCSQGEPCAVVQIGHLPGSGGGFERTLDPGRDRDDEDACWPHHAANGPVDGRPGNAYHQPARAGRWPASGNPSNEHAPARNR